MELASFRRASWISAAGRAFLAIDDSPAAFGVGAPVAADSDLECLEPAKQKRRTLLHAEESDGRKRDRTRNLDECVAKVQQWCENVITSNSCAYSTAIADQYESNREIDHLYRSKRRADTFVKCAIGF